MFSILILALGAAPWVAPGGPVTSTPATSPELAQERKPMSVDDGLNLIRVGGPVLTPDGRNLLYSKSELDWDKNKRKSSWWFRDARRAGSEPRQFLGEAGGSGLRWSPDGRQLAFLRKEGEHNQIFTLRADGGEALVLTKHEGGVRSFRWMPDSKGLVFSATDPAELKRSKERKAGDDAIAVDEGPNGQSQGSWNHLWHFDLSTKKERQLIEGDWRIASYEVSPSGSEVAFTARKENRRNQGNLSEIYLLGVEDGLVRRLTENEAPEGSLSWSPDGLRILFSAPDIERWELRLPKLWTIDPLDGEITKVANSFQGSLRSARWNEDGTRIHFLGQEGVHSDFYTLDLASGRAERRTDTQGSIGSVTWSRNGERVVYSRSDFDSPGDLYGAATSDFEAVRLTDANPWVEKGRLLGKTEVVRWKSQDGLEIEGLLVLPANHREGQKLPLMLNIHGGPAGVFSSSFRSDLHTWAGMGWASLCPNVRGSSGYSDELLRGNMSDLGGGDYQDLMTGVDAMIERGIADPEKLAVRGWSYGGILGGWTITQTQRFKAASIGAMVSDWTSEYGIGFNHDVRLWYIGGTPWENPEAYRHRSPLTHVAQVETPTLLIHGMNDTTDTEAQSMMFFQALKDQGKTARYLRFPREPHGFREPKHQRRRLTEEIAWLTKHTLGEAVTVEPRPSKPEGESK